MSEEVMNRDDIIRMAQDVSGVEFPASMDGVKIGMSIEHLERFANLVAAAEREACAKVCEAEGERVDASWVSCAFAIRERGAPALERLNKAAEDNGEPL
jgi:hypothetical protein